MMKHILFSLLLLSSSLTQAQTSDCLDLSSVDFGICTAYLGVVNYDGECIGLSGCSTTGADGIDYSEFFFDDMTECQSCLGDSLCLDESLIAEEILCPQVIEPVCGCNGVTYNNSCEAMHYYGVASYTEGPCSQVMPAPCDDLAGVDFGECDAIVGVAIVNGLCTTISGCSTVGSDGIDYADAFFGDMFECTSCQQSECFNPNQEDPNAGCFTLWEPVCGCDNYTYTNSCVAIVSGITSWEPGECGTVNPVIEPCDDLSEVDFGDCEAIIGVAIINGLCTSVSGCSTVGSDGIDYADAFFENMLACGECEQSECLNPNQINPDAACDFVYEPVCGCDSVTYSNDCVAFHAGATSWVDGECLTDNITENHVEFSVYPNPSAGEVVLETSIAGEKDVVVLNNLGEEIYNNQFLGISSKLDLSFLESGSYILLVRTQSEVLIKTRVVLLR